MLTIRLATMADLEPLTDLMDRAINELQKGFLNAQQIAASRAIMGIDTQLIRDETYFVVLWNGALAGCGGWSFRKTLYGGDHSKDLRDRGRLDLSCDAAKIRAMYTHPDFTRRGVGRAILKASEDAARAAGFKRAEMMATLAGVPLYERCGYQVIEKVQSPLAGGVDGMSVPLLRMGKAL
ncbi:acetyltransferase [Iodidimonas muriae]|uniref:Acetyltransferase n=1 Tax=Iodidimonas muriae TaxID=261467 RepID=A0ABQ2LDZ3_9PROT|nr:GNAT family N-acetyltransferase [Iodidimonas muriae]GER07149.1 acetyltransferase [Kordiimonadales bacterium JCM 17843]GGO12830.1 acetyltransferase [Iodidimonas muriae]